MFSANVFSEGAAFRSIEGAFDVPWFLFRRRGRLGIDHRGSPLDCFVSRTLACFAGGMSRRPDSGCRLQVSVLGQLFRQVNGFVPYGARGRIAAHRTGNGRPPGG